MNKAKQTTQQVAPEELTFFGEPFHGTEEPVLGYPACAARETSQMRVVCMVYNNRMEVWLRTKSGSFAWMEAEYADLRGLPSELRRAEKDFLRSGHHLVDLLELLEDKS